MDLEYSAADEVFRAEIRSWLSRQVPAHGPPPPSGDRPVIGEVDTDEVEVQSAVAEYPRPTEGSVIRRHHARRFRSTRSPHPTRLHDRSAGAAYPS